MDSTASDIIDRRDLDQWFEVTTTDDQAKQNRISRNRTKKRRKPLRKNRKPARPSNYIGQRTNNRLLKICTKNKD